MSDPTMTATEAADHVEEVYGGQMEPPSPTTRALRVLIDHARATGASRDLAVPADYPRAALAQLRNVAEGDEFAKADELAVADLQDWHAYHRCAPEVATEQQGSRRPICISGKPDLGPWVHDDGSTCDVFLSDRPYPSQVDRAQHSPDLWWCTEHQSHLRPAATPGEGAPQASEAASVERMRQHLNEAVSAIQSAEVSRGAHDRTALSLAERIVRLQLDAAHAETALVDLRNAMPAPAIDDDLAGWLRIAARTVAGGGILTRTERRLIERVVVQAAERLAPPAADGGATS